MTKMRQRRRQARVQVQREGEGLPRLPHERDESADSADVHTRNSREMGLQAAADLQSGQQDTSLRPVMEDTAQRMDAAPAPPPGGPAPVPSPPAGDAPQR